jgi:hypothetical protein
MPSRTAIIDPPIPANNKTVGTYRSLLYNGSKFSGSQKSKGNSYDVEVSLQVRTFIFLFSFCDLTDEMKQMIKKS